MLYQSNILKVIEQIIVLERLYTHPEQNNLITSQLHEFYKVYIYSNIQLIEHIIDQLEVGCVVTSLFLLK